MNTSKMNARTVSGRINAFRAYARKVSAKTLLASPCPCCTRAAAAPYRRELDGATVEGCVDAHHDAHRDAWHDRPQAAAIRLTELNHLATLMAG